MKVLVLDEMKSRKSEIVVLLEKSKHKATACSTSNEFITAVEDQSLNCICVDFETWHKGRAIYGYFQIPKKMEHVPVVMYNSPTHSATLSNRVKHEKDRVLPKPTDTVMLVDAVGQCF